ncbi:MAG TPA: hypothetical protein VFN25_07355 [Dokdonella sp.]|uniref:hypothetical protein n=1 Tax=Dokdonella sp. TaxID=2291710 RepID=UPI002D81012C|nr:hypothetical protein [Dokdonella sp.]HET9032705.1 hypothetical protein [Dokdonella sp.]
MNERPAKLDDADFVHDLMIGRAEASLPYELRKNTGLVIELNFIAGRTLQLLHETLSVARILHAGIDSLKGNATLVGKLRKEVGQTASGGELLSNNLHPMHSMVIVNLCSALEAGIDDTIIVALRFRPGLLVHLAKLGVTKLTTPVERDLTHTEAQHAASRLKAFTRTEKIAPNGWLRRLEAVRLPTAISDEHCRALREMIYVRNCIVHRAHLADEYCRNEMSILVTDVGRRIRVTQPAMAAYAGACMGIAMAIADIAQQPYL